MTSVVDLKKLAESLIFISGEGILFRDLLAALKVEKVECETVINTLIDEYLERDGGIFIQEVAGKIKFVTSEKVFPSIRTFIQEKKKETLSRGVLETLAIITYRQPITLFEIDEIRGVSSRSMIVNLLTKRLIKSIGKKDSPGKPTLYGTSSDFLEFFGISSLEELPSPKEVKELNFEDLE